MSNPTPSVMRMVLFVNAQGNIRPAIIHQVHSDTCVSLSVFQSANDLGDAVVRQTSVDHDQEGKKPGTWHWNEHQMSTGKPSH